MVLLSSPQVPNLRGVCYFSISWEEFKSIYPSVVPRIGPFHPIFIALSLTTTCLNVCNSLLIVLSCEIPRSILIKPSGVRKAIWPWEVDVHDGSGSWEKGGGQPNKTCKENTQVYTCPGETSHFLPKVSSFLIWYKTVIGNGRTAVGFSPMSLSSRDKGRAGAYHRKWTVPADQNQDPGLAAGPLPALPVQTRASPLRAPSFMCLLPEAEGNKEDVKEEPWGPEATQANAPVPGL